MANKKIERVLYIIFLICVILNLLGFMLMEWRIGGCMSALTFLLFAIIPTFILGILSAIYTIQAFKDLRWPFKIIGFIPPLLGVLYILIIVYQELRMAAFLESIK